MKKIHFIGIGGIGMSALADISLSEGKIVTGSDLRLSDLTARLCEKGATVHGRHSADNVPDDVDLVVRSTCIRDDNPEVGRARELGVPVIFRSEMLRMFVEKARFSIAVTGTHGKTTTSALVAHVIEHCGKDPMVIVGGEMECFSGNAKVGHSGIIVAEVDESDGYFRNVSATCALVTNVEREHMEYYGSLDNLIDAYREFISRISPQGFFVFNGEDPTLRHLVGATVARKISFGINGEFSITCRRFTCTRSIEFDLVAKGRDYGRISSVLIGRHNLMNILGATALCMEMGFDFRDIAKAVTSFRGVKRRFNLIGRIGDVEVIEDYAHHPTEIRSVITAAGNYSKGRVVTIFQPHRYSRTRDLMYEFSECFYGSDVVILTDIYPASEDKINGITVRDMYEIMDKSRFRRLELARKEDIPEFVPHIVRDGDIILVLGAGDIGEIAGVLVERIERRFRNRQKTGDRA